MSNMFGGALPEKEKFFNIFNKHSKVKDKSCLNGDSSQYHVTDGKQNGKKIKQLKSRKERSQRRRQWRETSKTASHYHHRHSHQSSNNMARDHKCCHSGYHSRRHASFTSVVPAAQEPSIITGSRLIGHHGLFNHEVKSIDIERLLNEQRKLESSVQEVTEKKCATTRLPSITHIPSPFSSNNLLGADSDVAKKKEDPAANKEKKNLKFSSQETDITPGQRPQQQPDDLSSGSIVSTKHSSLIGVTTQTKKDKYVMSEKESQQTSITDKDSMMTPNNKIKRQTTPQQTPRNQLLSVQDTQTNSLILSPLQLSSSPTADSCNTQHRRQDPDYVSKSVSAVAARLCECLQFPFLKRRNLVSESREVLLKSMRERHGARLQKNLSEVQRWLNLGVYSTEKDGGPEPTVEEDEFLEPTSKWHFNWKSSPQMQKIPEQVKNAEWPFSPMDTCASVFGDILRPDVSPQLCMDFEPSGSTVSSLFAPSATFHKVEIASTSDHWEDRFNGSMSKESPKFDFFEKRFIHHTTAVRERSCGPQYQPLFPCRTQLPPGHSAKATDFKQVEDPFEPDRDTLAPSFPLFHSHPFQPFSQSRHPSAQPALMSHHTDMMHYPPSHMLDREAAPSISSFLSPEHWSFPPMRLY